jgi:5-(carboxyamino)imidazole ribonucleotide synthase
MVNLLGFEHASDEYAERRSQLAALPGASVHWYGKHQAIPGRKLGHITLLLDAPSAEQRQAQASNRLAAVRAIWPLPTQPSEQP